MSDLDVDIDSSFEPTPTQELDVTPEPVDVRFYYIACLTALYVRDGKLKQRLLNIRLDLNAPQVNLQALNQCNMAAIGRVMQELNLKQEDIKDIVLNSISFLGAMTPETFEAQVPTLVDGGLPPTEQAPDQDAATGLEK